MRHFNLIHNIGINSIPGICLLRMHHVRICGQTSTDCLCAGQISGKSVNRCVRIKRHIIKPSHTKNRCKETSKQACYDRRLTHTSSHTIGEHQPATNHHISSFNMNRARNSGISSKTKRQCCRHCPYVPCPLRWIRKCDASQHRHRPQTIPNVVATSAQIIVVIFAIVRVYVLP